MQIKTWLMHSTILLVITMIGACAPVSDELNEESAIDVEDSRIEENIDEMDDAVDDVRDDNMANRDEQAYMEEKLAESYFQEVEVSITYPNDRDYEFEISKDDGIIEASLEDELSRRQLKGKKAFDFIYERMVELPIDKNEEFKTIRDKIISAFDLQEDYVKFDIEIIFQDGSVIEFEYN